MVSGEIIEHITALYRLRSLSMGYSFGDRNAARLESFPNIEYLFLNHTAVTDQAMEHVGKLRKL